MTVLEKRYEWYQLSISWENEDWGGLIIRLENKKKRIGKPKLTLRRVIQYNLEALHISDNLTQNHLKWKKRIHITDLKFWDKSLVEFS